MIRVVHRVKYLSLDRIEVSEPKGNSDCLIEAWSLILSAILQRLRDSKDSAEWDGQHPCH